MRATEGGGLTHRRTAALIWSCLQSALSRNVSRGNTWKAGGWGGRYRLGSWLRTRHTCMHKHTSHMCEASLGSQSAALNKASLLLPLIAGSICRRGVEFLISALTERGEMGIGEEHKMDAPANKWNQTTPSSFPLLFFPPPPAGTILPHFSLKHIELYPTKQAEKKHVSFTGK